MRFNHLCRMYDQIEFTLIKDGLTNQLNATKNRLLFADGLNVDTVRTASGDLSDIYSMNI